MYLRGRARLVLVPTISTIHQPSSRSPLHGPGPVGSFTKRQKVTQKCRGIAHAMAFSLCVAVVSWVQCPPGPPLERLLKGGLEVCVAFARREGLCKSRLLIWRDHGRSPRTMTWGAAPKRLA